MRRRREYVAATSLDPDSLVVVLISVDDKSGGNESRSIEVLNFTAQILVLASKRGRVALSATEVFDEAA